MSEITKLWGMGTYIGPSSDQWTLGGIFDSEEKAIKACKTHRDFIGPINLNEEQPSENEEWPNAYYPLQ
jgi:hypothetical protein